MPTLPATTTSFNGADLSELFLLIRTRNLSRIFEVMRSMAGSLDHMKEELLSGGKQGEQAAELTIEDIHVTACEFLADTLNKMIIMTEFYGGFTIRPVEAAHALDFFLRDWAAADAKGGNENNSDEFEDNDEDWADMDEVQHYNEDEEMEEEEEEEVYDDSDLDIDSDEEMDDEEAENDGEEENENGNYSEIIASALNEFYKVFPEAEIARLTDEQFKKEFLLPIMRDFMVGELDITNDVVSMMKRAMYAYVVTTLCKNEN